MGKVLKPLLVVAAIAVNVIPGVGQVLSAAIVTSITTAGVTAALALGASALGLGPKSPKVSPASRDRLFANVNPSAFRTLAFGETAFATDIRYQEWEGSDQEYFNQIIALASHKITSVRQIWLDDKLAWTSSRGAQGEYAGYLTVDVRLEGNAANYVTIGTGSRWGATRRLTGIAYIRTRMKVTGNGKKKESPFAQSIPSRMTVIGEGMPVYDPRYDDTRGGAGPLRADDQSTWKFRHNGDDIGRNPSNQAFSYLLGWRIAGRLAVGRGIPPDRFDPEAFITASNACDESVTLATGGTEPRYRSDGIFNEGDDPRSVIDSFEATANAKLRDAGGRFAFVVLHNDLGSPVFAFDDSDVLDSFKWTPVPDITQTYNAIRGRFTDPSTQSLYQLVDYPGYRETPVDGIERVLTFDVPLVQSGSQAQRLAKQQFARNQYQGKFECELGVRGWAVQLGDVVTLTFSALGWQDRLFRVVEHGIRPDGICPVVLQEENANIYLWDADEAPVVAPTDLVPYDATKAVLLQLLEGGQLEYADGSSLESLKPGEAGATDGATADQVTAIETAAALAAGKSTVFYQATPPAAAQSEENDLWIDTSDNNFMYRRVSDDGNVDIDGDNIELGVGNFVELGWVASDDQRISRALQDAAGAQATADGKIITFSQETQPTAEGLGDLWHDTATNTLKRWDGLAWVEAATIGATAAQASDIAQAISAAGTAQATADGKITTYYQTTEPTGGSEGDLWIDTDNDNRLSIHQSGFWLNSRDTGITNAITAAAGAQATADGKVTSFYVESAPTAEAVGDLWYQPSTQYLSRWTGSAWVEISNIGATTGQVTSIAAAGTLAAEAKTIADNKNALFYQSTPPAAAQSEENDRWIDTDDGNLEYRRVAGDGNVEINGSDIELGVGNKIALPWVTADDQRIGTAIVNAAGAQATADGKVATFFAESAPTAEAVGDLWYQPSTELLKRWDGLAWVGVATVGAPAGTRVGPDFAEDVAQGAGRANATIAAGNNINAGVQYRLDNGQLAPIIVQEVSGFARDGDVISFDSAFFNGDVPEVDLFGVGKINVTGGAGDVIFQKLRALGLSSTGFTLEAKIVTTQPGSLTPHTDTGDAAGGGSDPDRVMSKSQIAEAYDDRYTFTFSVNVTLQTDFSEEEEPPFILYSQSGTAYVSILVHKGTGWETLITVPVSASHIGGVPIASKTVTVSYTVTVDGLGQHGGDEFGASIASGGTGGSGLDIINVKYETQAGDVTTEQTATPMGAEPIRYVAKIGRAVSV